MYDLYYVKKRRRRRIAALLSVICAIGVGSLVTISFLGRTVGTFTVSVQNSTVNLALCDKQDFNNPTSYLRIDELPSTYLEYSYDWFPSFDSVDNETNDYFFGSYREEGKVVGMYYLKYTFYIKNIGSKLAQYTMSINLDDCTQSNDSTGRKLDDTLRVMVFENDPLEGDTHDYTVYAKDIEGTNNNKYKTWDKDGAKSSREFISSYPNAKEDGFHEDDAHPLAESFEKGKAIIKKTVENFRVNDIRRYTLVYWLEGSDPQANVEGQDAPQGAKIKLSVDFAATSYSV